MQLEWFFMISYKIAFQGHIGAQLDFTQEMDKLLFMNFSVLELHLTAMEHVSGGLVSRLLKMHHVQTATQRLKVNLHYYYGVLLHALCMSYMHSVLLVHCNFCDMFLREGPSFCIPYIFIYFAY